MSDLFDEVPAEKPEPGHSRYTVTGLTRIIKSLLEDNIPVVTVEGELSNYVRHTSGHRYFTLKDETSQIKCVMFKWQAASIRFEPEEGMKLLAVGSVNVYERGGQYQLNVVRLMPMGRGDLLARLEELKRKLAEEGIFANNRPIPPYPSVIGVVTSPTGAAVRDILNVIGRRAPQVRIILRPTLVQGASAGEDIERAIRELNSFGGIDTIIVGRGGGSIEDLWCFNEERVARAIAASAIPVISAVGHETDFTLADFAADLRAPTPSAAAELAVRDAAEARRAVDNSRRILHNRMISYINELDSRVNHARKGLSPARLLQYIQMKAQAVDELTLRMRGASLAMLASGESRVERLTGSLRAMNPKGVLTRGYAIVYRADDRAVVTDPAMVTGGGLIDVEVAHGTFGARIENGGELTGYMSQIHR